MDQSDRIKFLTEELEKQNQRIHAIEEKEAEREIKHRRAMLPLSMFLLVSLLILLCFGEVVLLILSFLLMMLFIYKYGEGIVIGIAHIIRKNKSN